MSLRARAERDVGRILENSAHMGWSIQVTNPDGVSESLTGFSNDISQVIDPDTGQAVSGRLASVALRISSLVDSGLGDMPKGIADAASKPWLVTFDDINGNEYTFKVSSSDPDRTVGMIVCMLGLYTT